MKHHRAYQDYVTLYQIGTDALSKAHAKHGTFTEWLGDRSIESFECDPEKDHLPGNQFPHARAMRVYGDGYGDQLPKTVAVHDVVAAQAAAT